MATVFGRHYAHDFARTSSPAKASPTLAALGSLIRQALFLPPATGAAEPISRFQILLLALFWLPLGLGLLTLSMMWGPIG